MKKEELKPGDCVEFLSGGPTMTITAEGLVKDWTCGWFARDEYKETEFASSVLKKVDRPRAYKGML